MKINTLALALTMTCGSMMAAKADFNIALGSTELVPDATPTGVPVYPWFPDGHLIYLPDQTPGQYQMYWAGSSSYRTTGTSMMGMTYQAGTVALPKGQPGEFDNGGAWLMSVFRQSGDDMVGFFHGEDHEFPPDPNPGQIAWKSIAVCTSTDNGVSWTKGGQIITAAEPKPATPTWGGNGDNCVVYDAANSRWVCYYAKHNLHMAISNDPNGAPGTWKKYYNGTFDQDGLGGLESPVPGLESRPGANPSVHFNTYLNQWVMVWHSWQSNEGSIWLSTSTDMVNWRTPVSIVAATGNEKMWYPTIVGSSDVEAGQQAWLCYAYWPDQGNWQRQFLRRDITFTLTGTPSAPIGLTAIADASSVSLDWPDSAETDLSHYTVYRSTNSGSGHAPVATNLTSSDFTDTTISSGTTYYYVVTATDTDGDQSAYSNEVSANSGIYSNLMINGDFSNGLGNWSSWTYTGGGRTASFNVVGGELVVSNINGGGVPDWISVLNGPVDLTQGKTYVISFDARSTAKRVISVGPRKGSGDYAAYSIREKLIDTTMKRYSFTYTHTAASDPTAQLIFFLGNSDDTVHIDNVALGEKIPAPGAGVTLKLLPIGDSISQGNIYGAGTYRKPLYYEMTDSGHVMDFVGSHDILAGTNATNGSPDSDPGWDQDNEAWWGYTTGQLETILTTSVNTYDYDVALIHLGTNDPDTGGIQNLKDIIDILRGKNPDVVVFLAQLIAPNNGNSSIATFNSLIPGVVAEKNTAQSPVILVNQYTTLVPGTSDYVDGLHPSKSGAAKMAAVWLDAINAHYETVVTYTLTYTAGSGGTISGASTQTVIAGSDGSAVTAVSNSGYQFAGWSDGVATATRTDTNVTANLGVTASFQPVPISAPTGLVVSAGAGSASLDWNDNSEPTLSHYTVYRSTTSGSGYAAIATNLATSHDVDNTVSQGVIYYYVVTATDTDSNESAYSNEDSASFIQSTEILVNGDFSNGLNQWSSWTYTGGGRTADFNVVGGELVVSNIDGGGVADWITILNGPVSLLQGNTYTISFQARSTASRTIKVGPRKASGDYALYASNVVTLGTTMQTYSFDFVHTEASDPAAQLIFLLGATNDSVTIDHVSLLETPAGGGGYSVTYNGNGHTGGSVPASQTKTQGINLTLATNTGNLVRSGHTFTGWNTASNGSGMDYAEGATYSTDADVILHAKWNALPVANDDSVTTDKDMAVAITLAASDTDEDSLTYTVVTGPANGALSGTAPNLTYTPDFHFSGNDSFTFKVNDGTDDSNTATVSINVQGVRVLDYAATTPGTVKTFKVALLMINTRTAPIADNPVTKQLEFYTPETLGQLFFEHEHGAASFIKEASYGKIALEGRVVGWLDAPQAGLNGTNISSNAGQYISLADAYLTHSDYDVFIVHSLVEGSGQQTGWLYPQQSFTSTTQGPVQNIGITWMANSTVFDFAPLLTSNWSSGESVLPTTSWAHELLHTFGITGHANSYDCGTSTLDLNSASDPVKGYGGVFSIMGEYAFATHPDALMKSRIGWLTPAQVPEINASGTYEIHPLAVNDGQTKALVIPLATPISHSQNAAEFDALVVEYRTATGFDRYLERLNGSPFLSQYTTLTNIDINGVVVYMRYGSTATDATALLDMNPATTFKADRGIKIPGNVGKFADAILPVNSTFTWDNIQITPLGTTEAGAMRVSVTISPPNPYVTWAGGPFANPFTDVGTGMDPDGDGLKNFMEFALGTDPTAGVSGSIVYQAGGDVTTPGLPEAQNLAAGGGVDFRAVFIRRKDYQAAGLGYIVQFSADLSNWVTGSEEPTVLTDPDGGGDLDAVSVPFPLSIPADGGQETPTFFRVGVSME